jgi:mannose-6-phosphate isomerase
MSVGPVIFTPLHKPRVWGGRRFAELLGRELPEGVRVGESWEVCDLEGDQSVVCRGHAPAIGRSLHELVEEWGADLTGRAPLPDGRFPLLLKFLDAREALSVQVHPDEASVARFAGGARAKSEAWYVVHAKPGAFMYRGLAEGVDADRVREALRTGEVISLLRRVELRKGHGYYLPGGTPHALGGGVVVAEVQTPSDTTFRLYDWDRLDDRTGAPRALHVEEALACLHYGAVDTAAEQRAHVASVWTAVTRLVRCPFFQIERVRMVEGVDQDIPHEELVIWMVLEGRARVTYAAGEPVEFGVGDTVVIPAAMRGARVRTLAPAMWLEVTIPIPSALSGMERPERERPDEAPSEPGFVPLGLPHHRETEGK